MKCLSYLDEDDEISQGKITIWFLSERTDHELNKSQVVPHSEHSEQMLNHGDMCDDTP